MIKLLSQAEKYVADKKQEPSIYVPPSKTPNMKYILELFFDACKLCAGKYSEEDKHTIAVKIANVIELLLLHLEKITWDAYSDLDSVPFDQRSAIKFIYDDFGSVEIGKGTLADLLDNRGVENMMKNLDIKIEGTKSYVQMMEKEYPDWTREDGIEDRYFVLLAGEGLPDTHKWWKLN